jgi:hypothetical protein
MCGVRRGNCSRRRERRVRWMEDLSLVFWGVVILSLEVRLLRLKYLGPRTYGFLNMTVAAVGGCAADM